MSEWREGLQRLDIEHRHMLQGGALSSLFLRYPLNVANPAFVGGFYGILIGLALLPLSASFGDLTSWPSQTASIIALTGVLGVCSLLFSMILKRPPIRLENRRRYLFPFPFVGLLLLGFGKFYELGVIVENLALALLVLPGPLYIHISYAPRWRILSRMQRNLDPFQGMKFTIYEEGGGGDPVDSELDEAVSEA